MKKPIIYPIGILKKAPQAAAAKELAAFLQTDEAAQVFAKYGFARAK
ncbi:MAG: substrate-binding domain-containing protein [Phascolarctobacterium sp.]